MGRPKKVPEAAPVNPQLVGAVEKGVRRTRRFHEIGKASLKRAPKNAHGTGRRLKEQALRKKWNVRKLHHARQFAGAFNDEQLNELCDACICGEFVLEYSHLSLLLTIKDIDKRLVLQKQMIADRLGCNKLGTANQRVAETRRRGGRRSETNLDLLSLLVDAEKRCNEWKRWDEDNRLCEPSFSIPKQIKELLKETRDQIERLHDAVEKKLPSVRLKVSADQQASPSK